MKSFLTVLAMCVFGAGSAAGQTLGNLSAANGQPAMFAMQDHPQHAIVTEMAHEEDLLEHSNITYARGERPLWEVMQETPTTPLGDMARALKHEHANAKKALLIWKN